MKALNPRASRPLDVQDVSIATLRLELARGPARFALLALDTRSTSASGPLVAASCRPLSPQGFCTPLAGVSTSDLFLAAQAWAAVQQARRLEILQQGKRGLFGGRRSVGSAQVVVDP